MAAMFGHTWTSQYGDAPDGVGGDTWAAALAGLTPLQVGDGLHAALKLGGEFPPSAPHFRALCFRVPTFAEVRYETQHGEVARTGFGILCWRFVDAYALRRADQRDADRLMRDAYELAKAHVMAGGAVPKVPEALAKPEPDCHAPARPETIERVKREVAEHLRAAEPPAADPAP